MSTPNPDEGFDRTPEGEAVARMLRQIAPPATDPRRGANAVLARIAAKQAAPARLNLMRWLAPAAGIAAAALIVLVIALPEDATVPAPRPDAPHAPVATTVSRGAPEPALVARLRGASGTGWRLDAGLKDGLRVGDKLAGHGGVIATVVAAGIFDSRVRVDGAAARGDRFTIDTRNAAQQRAHRLEYMGGDPGAFLDMGAILDPVPFGEARIHGLGDGGAVRVAEVIPAILRDYDAEPEVSLAAKLGLHGGDVIERANGMRARDLGELARALELGRGGRMALTVIRNGRRMELATR